MHCILHTTAAIDENEAVIFFVIQLNVAIQEAVTGAVPADDKAQSEGSSLSGLRDNQVASHACLCLASQHTRKSLSIQREPIY
jgi:hypothetical protein